ncbi:MAG: ROK family protein [Phreatobacter sp.]|nr:ROK family protein [Phreatobacter sp.]
MGKTTAKKVARPRSREPIAGHGAAELPSVTVSGYNLELRDKDGFIGDRASRGAFRDKLDDWRERLDRLDADPFGDVETAEISKKQLDKALQGEDTEAAALVHGAIEDFAQELSGVIRRFRRTKGWEKVERIAVGGGFRNSRIGELAIARTGILLKGEGLAVDMRPIRHHPDEAGLIGAAHLMPAWMLAGHDGILAIDIGGTNMRAGVVVLNVKKAADLSKAEVWKSDLWRHADDDPARTTAIETLAGMLQDLIARAGKEGLTLAPVIGIGCPGLIATDGAIARGGQNLPGGNWESEHFNLPAALIKAIPEIGGHETLVVMHNDAVVQGLSEVPDMQDVAEWGVVTIGTGLGNATYVNRG